MDVFGQVQAECMALGTRLFTVTRHDAAAGLVWRCHTSHPREYPAGGTKPLPHDAWHAHCVERLIPFIANTPEAFRALFPDHALIESMGLGAALNLPVINAGGEVLGTLNLLAGTGHFTPERLAAAVGVLNRHHGALCAALA